MTKRIRRREFGTAMAAGMAGLWVGSSAGRVRSSGNVARFEILDADGEPVAAEQLGRFHACDERLRPIPTEPRIAAGSVELEPPERPFRVSVPLVVPGFGHVYVYADRRGQGYTRDRFSDAAPLLLNYEAASDRLVTVRELATAVSSAGTDIPGRTKRRIRQAADLLRKATGAEAKRARAGWSLESLRESLFAGEELAMARARAAISRRGERPGFLFGANAFQYPEHRADYAGRFEALFDYATLPFYLGGTQPREGETDFTTADQILRWLADTPILAKGHPLIFLYPSVTPEWLRSKSSADAMRACVEYVRDCVSRYRDRIHVWDVVNELHDQNELGLTRDEMVRLTRDALIAAREADPTCFRIVNHCCPWCEYLIREVPPGKQSILDYLQALADAGCSYEAIGLQYYYYGRDLLEIDRSLETFSALGKPVHVTELGVPSSSREVESEWPNGVGFPWHGERWTESIQADWIEGFYTLAFSKPWIEAIGWWDLADPAFVPHGGLLHRDLRPKEGYRRLRSLIRSWKGGDR